jgi:RNA polymerase sigma-70 factor (ECF subfamily)
VDEDAYSIEELSELVAGLGDADMLKLKGAARGLVLKCWSDPDDLLNEAIIRSLDGRRSCPRKMKLVAFLFGVMRSVADEWLKDRKSECGEVDETRWGRSAEVDVEALPDQREGQEAEIIASERRAFAASVLKEVMEMFETDEEAWFIVEADLEGRMTPEEICSALGIDRRRYDTARKRIRRGYDKIRNRHRGDRP